jgi:hypothetical protein
MRAKPKCCECGRADLVFYNNYWMCVRCRELERAEMYQRRVRAVVNRMRAEMLSPEAER